MPDQTTPAVEWWDDPDVVSWDWREPASPDALRRVLTRHGLTVTEIDTGADQYAIRITGRREPDHCQVTGEYGESLCVRAMEQAPCRTCPAAPEPATRPAEHAATPPAADEPAGSRLMDIAEFRRHGYLQEVNRQFLHPLGLALAVHVADDGTERLSGVWDDRDDPEGIRYGPGMIDRDKAARVLEAQRRMADSRTAMLGYVMQPVDEAATPPADPDPHPDTQHSLAPDTPPHASGILGSALQDRDGSLWRHRGGADGDLWAYPDSAQAITREEVQYAYGPVREVLLVDPAAWEQRERVIAAARDWHADWKAGQEPTDDDLAAAVDALTGAGTDEGAPARCTDCGCVFQDHEVFCWRCGAGRPDPSDKPGPAEVAEALKAGNVACVQTIDRDLQAFAELPDCPHCDGCGKQVPPDWYGGPQPAVEPCGATDGNGLVCDREVGHPPPCDQIQRTDPEPAGDGPGWQRDTIHKIAARMLTPELRAEVEALLAERDQLGQRRVHLEGDLRRAGEQLDRVTEQLDECYRDMTAAQQQRDTARAELAAVTADLTQTTTDLAEVTAERDRQSDRADEAEQRVDRLLIELGQGDTGPILTGIDPAWDGTCDCEDKSMHGTDCRQGHGTACDEDCSSRWGCPRLLRHALFTARAEMATMQQRWQRAMEDGDEQTVTRLQLHAELGEARQEAQRLDRELREAAQDASEQCDRAAIAEGELEHHREITREVVAALSDVDAAAPIGEQVRQALATAGRDGAAVTLRNIANRLPSNLDHNDLAALAELIEAGKLVICCDLHNTHCEPPSELCCGECTEVRHPEHPDGVLCVLSPLAPAATEIRTGQRDTPGTSGEEQL